MLVNKSPTLGYAVKSRTEGEVILHHGTVTWWHVLQMFGYSVFTVSLLTWAGAGAVALLGWAWAIEGVVDRWFTEYTVTDRRVIVKRGMIRRSVDEIHINRIEGVDLEQTVLQRILRFGTLTVLGQGTQRATMRHTGKVMHVRSILQYSVDNYAQPVIFKEQKQNKEV